mgnify:CR=1 FL=1
MDNEKIKQIIEDKYDDSQETTIRAMIADFYTKKMRSVVIFVWSQAIVYIALAVFAAVMFFRAVDTRDQLMYATIFITMMLFICLLKILAFNMMQRNFLRREIKKLELRIAQLDQSMTN